MTRWCRRRPLMAGWLLVAVWLPLALGCETSAVPAGGGPPPSSAAPTPAAAPRPAADLDRPRQTSPAPPALADALRTARDSQKTLNAIDDYTCVFVKRERVDGELLDEQRLRLKVRHEPLGVYMRFTAPESLAGQEAVYVAGENDGKLLAHTTGLRGALLGTLALEPTGYFAMLGNRYAITDTGMKKLLVKLVALGEQQGLLDDCEVKFLDDQKVDERPCTCIEIRNPAPKGDFKLSLARVLVDDEWNVPVRFEAFEWPDDQTGEPLLVEQYTYLKLKFNQGLTDADFDTENPAYEFP